MTEPRIDPREEFVNKLFMQVLGFAEMFGLYLGDKLGLYRVLAEGPATPGELAARAGIAPRYAREWLEQQTVAGVLTVDDETADAEARVFSLPEAHAEALTDPDSPYSAAPLAQMLGMAVAIPSIVEAYRSGSGVAWEAYGSDLVVAQGGFNRPWLRGALGNDYLPSIPDVHARLGDAQRPARVLDVACGAGWAAIAVAQAYPHVTVTGIDLDPESIELARKNAAEVGVTDRVSFEVADASKPHAEGAYDLALVIEAVHDVSDPVGLLGGIRRALVPGGVLIVADEATNETFTANADERERLFYASSIFVCLPTGMHADHSAETGAVMRPDTFRRYSADAGFPSVEILDIPHPMMRFYRLDKTA